MPDIYPVFQVFDVGRNEAEDALAAANGVNKSELDRLGADISFIHPEYEEILIGVREDVHGVRRYPVMLLTTNEALYNRARLRLTKSL